MAIGRIRNLAGPIGCQAVVDDKVCYREENATIHRKNFGPSGNNSKHHEYVAPDMHQSDDEGVIL